ncbi:MAG: hypothetical protein J1F40_10450 [Prevotellaceae bacterium]|nr:hypothetical protein [Prevotellaceae bacterium]
MSPTWGITCHRMFSSTLKKRNAYTTLQGWKWNLSESFSSLVLTARWMLPPEPTKLKSMQRYVTWRGIMAYR